MSDQLYNGEDHTTKYRLNRPSYPKELFEHIITYYFDGTKAKGEERIPLALDVGCGSGQATKDISSFCDRVIGIDISADQLAHAVSQSNIEYRCNRGEDLSFLPSNSTDLITIATTFHWLDIEVFVREAKRVLKPQAGVLAIWTYTFGTLHNPVAEAVYYEFHNRFLRPYWNAKQHLVDDYYESLVSLLPYQSTLRQYTIECHIETTLGQFLGFIETGSACQTYRKQHSEQVYHDTLKTLREKLIQSYVETDEEKNVDFDSIKVTLSRPIRLYLMKKKDL